MLKNLSLKLSISQLLLSNVHVGHTRKFLKSSVKPYILGYRNNIFILNIKQTIVQFKLLIQMIINLISLRQKILLIKDRDVFNFSKLLKLKYVYYSDKKWIGGSLTNYRQVYWSKKLKLNEKLYDTFRYMRYMPSLVFFFDSNLSKWALMEASNLDLPIFSIVDTDIMFLDKINYRIIGNNKNFESIFLYLNLIVNSVLKGRRKELLKILRIV